MDFKHWHISKQSDGILTLSINVAEKSVNILTRQVIVELDSVLNFIEDEDGVKAVVLMSGKPQGFVYGADINEFESLKTDEMVIELLDEVHGIFNRLAGLSCPTVACIDGFALGGGLELALCCDAIIAADTPKTQAAFPEVKLGLMPGYGGTGRAYRRVGAEFLLEMMLTGRMVSAAEAAEKGLIDRLVETAADFMTAAKAMIEKPAIKAAKKPENIADIINEATSKYLKNIRPDHTPAPYAIIDHVAENANDEAAMSAGEKLIFPALMGSDASDGLRRNYQLGDMVRKTAKGDSKIRHVHVIGGGTMGGDIAAVAAMCGFEVSLSDLDPDAVKAAISRAEKLFERRLKTPEKIASALSRLAADEGGKGLAKADMIIEAVAENLNIKQDIFAAIEKLAKPDAIFASNTSSIPLEEIASALQNPSRLIGLHFFNPAAVLPLVEVIKSRYSDTEAIRRAMAFVGQLKKMPIGCQSAPGFLVNRALLPYINGAIAMMIDGMEADKIDQAMVDFGMPMGPIELADQIGLDVMRDASRPLDCPQKVTDTLNAMIEKATLGRKTGQGFYPWDDKKAIRPRRFYKDSELKPLCAALLQPMIEQCRQAVNEGVVESPDHADAAMILGVGFPAFRGGVLHYAKKRGDVRNV